MKLTEYERISLINQFKILEKIDSSDSSYSKYISILKSGFETDYDSIYPAVIDEAVPINVTGEVKDILEMHSAMLSTFYSSRNHGDVDFESIKFRGFDGNNETSQLVYTRQLIYTEGKFTELEGDVKSDELNSHMELLPKYRPMLRLWKQYENRHQLTIDQVKELLNVH